MESAEPLSGSPFAALAVEPVAFDDLLAHANGLQKAIGPADVAEGTVSEVGEAGRCRSEGLLPS